MPLRLEVGPRDVAKGVGMVKSRLGGEKEEVALEGGLGEGLKRRLGTFHEELFEVSGGEGGGKKGPPGSLLSSPPPHLPPPTSHRRRRRVCRTAPPPCRLMRR